VANALDIEIPATTVTAGVMYGALNQGWGDLDFASLYKIYETQPVGVSSAELQSGFAQIEDLDAKEVHYPDTKVPAPPRPLPEPTPEPASVAKAEPTPATPATPALPPAADEKKLDVPSLATALSAPAEVKPAELKPAEVRLAEPPAIEPIPATTHVILPGHVNVPGMVLLAPVEPTLTPPPGLVILGEAPAGKPAGEGAVILKGDLPAPPAADSKPLEFSPLRAENARGGAPAPIEKQHAAGPERTNGDQSEDFDGNAKPFNFVKRWFVSRTGG
jgi:hypothetical protein